MQSTVEIKLPSGLTAVVREMTAKHQEIISNQKNRNNAMNILITDLLVSVGERSQIDEKLVMSLLAADRKKILLEARQLSLDTGVIEDNPKDTFKFIFKYAENSAKKELEMFVPMSAVTEKPYTKQIATYEELDPYVEITLPKSKKIVRYKMLTGLEETAAGQLNKSDLSTHTPITMRNPVYFLEGDTEKLSPIKLDLNGLSLLDIEYLRKHIAENEGDVDTTFIINHPVTQEEVKLDMLGQTSFFYPSQVL